MEAPSFVSKARTAFNSAAARAERVFTDFKSDRLREDSDQLSPRNEDPSQEADLKTRGEVKQSRWRPGPLGRKQDWQERIKNINFGRKAVEDSEKIDDSTMAVVPLYYDDKLYIVQRNYELKSKAIEAIPSVEVLSIKTNNIPPTSVIKQLALAAEAGKMFKSMKDIFAASGTSSPGRDRAGLSLSAVKSLVLRDKEDNFTSKFEDERMMVLIGALFEQEGNSLTRKIGSELDARFATSFPRDIHGAPPESFVVKLSEVIGNFKTLKRMAFFWCKVVAELKRFWSEGKHIPGIPLDGIPDLGSCLLYQQLQVINCCLSRKRRRAIATESLESVMSKYSLKKEESTVSTSKEPVNSHLYARVNTGELVLRLGADNLTENLAMLETGEPIYAPVTQEGPLLTEDLIKETEELVLRTGSVGAGCSQLLSDMQAFKAANPGGVLEDFVRWHSPPDWTESESNDQTDREESKLSNSLVVRGQLSSRMQKEGNLWLELWETAKPIPAVKQVPLYDEDLAVDGILDFLEDIPPSELLEQLFISLVSCLLNDLHDCSCMLFSADQLCSLSLGFVLAETLVCSDDNLLKLFNECKEYVFMTCQISNLQDKLDDLCQVYETVETMLLSPEEVLKTLKLADEMAAGEAENLGGEPKRGFKKLSLFGSQDRQQRKSLSMDTQYSEGSPPRQPFASFFDSKSSLFSKKPPKPDSSPRIDKRALDEANSPIV